MQPPLSPRSEPQCPACHTIGDVVIRWTVVHEAHPEINTRGEFFVKDDEKQERQDDWELHCTACQYTWKPTKNVTVE